MHLFAFESTQGLLISWTELEYVSPCFENLSRNISVWQTVDGNGIFLVSCLSALQVCLHSSRREWVITHRIDLQ